MRKFIRIFAVVFVILIANSIYASDSSFWEYLSLEIPFVDSNINSEYGKAGEYFIDPGMKILVQESVDFELVLDLLGSDKWELVSVYPIATDTARAVFKRPRNQYYNPLPLYFFSTAWADIDENIKESKIVDLDRKNDKEIERSKELSEYFDKLALTGLFGDAGSFSYTILDYDSPEASLIKIKISGKEYIDAENNTYRSSEIKAFLESLKQYIQDMPIANEKIIATFIYVYDDYNADDYKLNANNEPIGGMVAVYAYENAYPWDFRIYV